MKMYERIADDRRRFTLAIVEAAGLAFGGESALRTWLSAQAPVTAGPDVNAVARQDAAIRRLQLLLSHQPNAGLRGAIRQKPD